jgi:hypothetical protein
MHRSPMCRPLFKKDMKRNLKCLPLSRGPKGRNWIIISNRGWILYQAITGASIFSLLQLLPGLEHCGSKPQNDILNFCAESNSVIFAVYYIQM